MWLGSPSTDHGTSTSEERTAKLKQRDEREDPEPNQARSLKYIVGAPASSAPAAGVGRLDNNLYQPKDVVLRLECTSYQQL